MSTFKSFSLPQLTLAEKEKACEIDVKLWGQSWPFLGRWATFGACVRPTLTFPLLGETSHEKHHKTCQILLIIKWTAIDSCWEFEVFMLGFRETFWMQKKCSPMNKKSQALWKKQVSFWRNIVNTHKCPFKFHIMMKTRTSDFVEKIQLNDFLGMSYNTCHMPQGPILPRSIWRGATSKPTNSILTTTHSWQDSAAWKVILVFILTTIIVVVIVVISRWYSWSSTSSGSPPWS